MLVALLTTLLVFDGILLLVIVLLQKGKGGVGLAGFGGGAQMLFGGSGGQDLFQKITWVLGAIFIVGSFLLAIVKARAPAENFYVKTLPTRQVMPRQLPTKPAQPPVEAPVAQVPEAPESPVQ